MTIRIVDREVNPVIATHWYLTKLIQEVPLVSLRAKELKHLNLPSPFIRRQTTDIIADCIRRVQSLYSWEKNSYTGILYREEHFNNEVNNFLDFGGSLKSIKSSVSEKSTIEHVIPVAYFKDRIFNLFQEGKLEESKLEIVKAFLSPVALIDKYHTNKDNTNKIKDSELNPQYPFKRYTNANINIFTHTGQKVDNLTWSIDQHWELLRRSNYFKDILELFPF